RVLPAAELERESMAFAQRLAQGPTVALGRLRRLMRTSFERDLPGQLDAESAAFRECAVTDDFRLGIDAFFAKKTPAFTGR
ncbi:MAG: enoyl-CoA hydratase-related protein, partial [Variovorax sp.]